MRLSTHLLIHVLGFGLNLSAVILFSLLHAPVMVVIFGAVLYMSYHEIHHVMEYLDALEAAKGEDNESQD
jgi:hypothetical protein